MNKRLLNKEGKSMKHLFDYDKTELFDVNKKWYPTNRSLNASL